MERISMIGLSKFIIMNQVVVIMPRLTAPMLRAVTLRALQPACFHDRPIICCIGSWTSASLPANRAVSAVCRGSHGFS